MSQDKQDTGNLTGNNRKPNDGRGARVWRALILPMFALCVVGMIFMFMAMYRAEKPQNTQTDIKPQAATLPAFPSDSFDPKAQSAPASTGQPPIPPDVADAIRKLEEDRNRAVQQLEESRSAGTGSGSDRPRPRVRVMSEVVISRPPETATPGGMQNASMEGGSGEHGDSGGRDARKGSVFSRNRLEKNFECQASAGQVITLKLPEGFNTEQEGEITAQVDGHSYSRDRSCLTIPAGSWFVGHYKNEVVRGQKRVSLTFTSIERPPPASDTIMLDGAKAYERDGRAGLTGEVNSNIPWGLIIASTVIDLGSAVLSNSGDGGGTDINIGGTIANNTGSVLRDVARDRYQKAPASIDVEPKAILVRLNQHLKMTPFPQS